MLHWFTEGQRCMFMCWFVRHSLTVNMTNLKSHLFTYFSGCAHIANTAVMDFCEPLWFRRVYIVYRTQWSMLQVRESHAAELCLLPFMTNHLVVSGLERYYIHFYFARLWIIKELSQDFIYQCCPTLRKHLPWLSYKLLLLYTVIAFSVMGNIGYANPLYTPVSFTGAMQQKLVTYAANYACC